MTTVAPKFTKRDTLREIELNAQRKWATEKTFESNAPAPGEPVPEKFMATFPYPYMNGRLHLGHCFTLTKIEFAAGYERMKGKRTLLPFGFHCTGMPIKACADKLKREVELFGTNFEHFERVTQDIAEEITHDNVAESSNQMIGEGANQIAAVSNGVAEMAVSADPTRIKKKHAKAEAKKGVEMYQFQIMESMGVPRGEIHKFAEAMHWLYYFPPIAKNDLMELGMKIDWRRSFITTSVNPYYDSFVRWQFRKLKQSSKIQFGERYTIYSPLDGQACMDHDRSAGEGVAVQEYTAIKLRVVMELLQNKSEACDLVRGVRVGAVFANHQSLLEGKRVYLIAATLRPETMYGQTNCFVGVDLEYGVYMANNEEVYICSERSARNMAWQGVFRGFAKGEVKKMFGIQGWDLVGLPLKAPLSSYEVVYTLPMEGVLANKGTGIVTSVPSDSPDDYITLLDLSKKPAYYNVDKKWIDPFLPPKPILESPLYGNLAALKVVQELKIQSQKDKKELAIAKEKVYKDAFYSGKLIVGDYAGSPVQVAKPLIKNQLIQANEGFVYCEPDGLVISRSGDECVVTLADQWYMNYGESEWKQQAEKCLHQMELYSSESRHNFEKTLDWLGQWACSRSFGLGTRLPWDEQFLIESLSDSTIYMAYYTVAHLLQGHAIDGSKSGLLNIRPEQLSDQVWDFVLSDSGPFPNDSDIPKEHLELLRREFLYFYPMDLRVSGKDLIPNHLTFCVYNHVALFPEHLWPKAMRANGHLLLNGDKMSKSTGNFMTLKQAVETYGADATRFAFADAGDGVEDANFLDKTANAAILRLFSELDWIQEFLNDRHHLTKPGEQASRLRMGDYRWHDLVFLAEMQTIIESADRAYKALLFRDALKFGFYDLQQARNEYRKAVSGYGTEPVEDESYEGLHANVVLAFIKTQALLLSPICPHWADHVWCTLLGEETSIVNSAWPDLKLLAKEWNGDLAVLPAAHFLRNLVSRIRANEDALAKKKAKKATTPATTSTATTTSNSTAHSPLKTLTLYVASHFPQWQDSILNLLKQSYNPDTLLFDGTDIQLLGQHGFLKDKKAMLFAAMMKKLVAETGPSAFHRALPFNELDTLNLNIDYLRRELLIAKIGKVIVVDLENEHLSPETAKKWAEVAVPGSPAYEITL